MVLVTESYLPRTTLLVRYLGNVLLTKKVSEYKVSGLVKLHVFYGSLQRVGTNKTPTSFRDEKKVEMTK